MVLNGFISIAFFFLIVSPDEIADREGKKGYKGNLLLTSSAELFWSSHYARFCILLKVQLMMSYE